MKRKLLFGVSGFGLLIGAGILWVVKCANRDSVNKYSDQKSNKRYSTDIPLEYTKENNELDLNSIKIQSVESIDDRHKAASKVVKESMEKINEKKELSSNHEKEFDSMFEDLDILSQGR